MVWQASPLVHYGLLALTAVASAVAAYAMMKAWRRGWIAVPLAGLTPALGILCLFFLLEDRQPVGPFFALIGLYHAWPALVVGLLAAGAGLFLFLYRDEQA